MPYLSSSPLLNNRNSANPKLRHVKEWFGSMNHGWIFMGDRGIGWRYASRSPTDTEMGPGGAPPRSQELERSL